jgi:hypothetical protein
MRPGAGHGTSCLVADGVVDQSVRPSWAVDIPALVWPILLEDVGMCVSQPCRSTVHVVRDTWNILAGVAQAGWLRPRRHQADQVLPTCPGPAFRVIPRLRPDQEATETPVNKGRLEWNMQTYMLAVQVQLNQGPFELKFRSLKTPSRCSKCYQAIQYFLSEAFLFTRRLNGEN